MNDIGSAALTVYLVGVAVGLVMIDARGPARLGLALLWPVGPIAFVVTITILLLALPIAFPVLGTVVLAALIGVIVMLWKWTVGAGL
jgi:hypothetical protein